MEGNGQDGKNMCRAVREINVNGFSRTEEISKYYSEWWENPKDIRNVVFNDLNKYVEQRILRVNNKKALDIGSGHGSIISYLVNKGYKVTAVEFNKEFVEEFKSKFPRIKVIAKDIRDVEFEEWFDITTCIAFVQNLERAELLTLLTKLADTTKLLLINMSNRNSLHARWVNFRGWRNSFVFNYTPKEFRQILEQAGFKIVHRRGIGLITPISLFKNFKFKLIPVWLAHLVSKITPLFPEICHLYYVEATSNKQS